MELTTYTAEQLFDWLLAKEDIVILDVRNEDDFNRFKVEGPYQITMVNVAYFDFSDEDEAEAVAKVPTDKPVRIVCAKESSSKFVGEVLQSHGFADVAYLQGGVKFWGNMLSAVRINPQSGAYGIYQFRRPGKASCSYGLVYQGEMFVFDPSRNVPAYLDVAHKHEAKITKSFETHRQADYISGSPRLQKEHGVEVHVNMADFDGVAFPVTPVADGQEYRFAASGGPTVKAMHTPGHTPGSTCYLIDDTYIVSGDTIFIESIGRPDLGGQARAWSDMLFATMTEKLLSLPDDVVVLPGHYAVWSEADEEFRFMATMAEVKRRNAAIYGISSQDDFYAFIESNMRPQPEEYAAIRQVNAGLKEVDEEEQETLDLGKNECAASAAAAAAAQS